MDVYILNLMRLPSFESFRYHPNTPRGPDRCSSPLTDDPAPTFGSQHLAYCML